MTEESKGSGAGAIGRPRLLEQVHNAIRRRYFSRRTEEAYVHWIKRFIYFAGKRHPVQDDPREGVRARGREMDKDGTYVRAGGPLLTRIDKTLYALHQLKKSAIKPE